MVLAHIVDELRTGSLMKIRHAAAEQREVGVLQFGQVEREGNSSLELRLYRVPVGRDHIHGRRTGERGHVQVGDLA